MNITNIDPQLFSSGAECLNAFFDGKVDMAFMGSVPFIIGKTSGVPIKILALVNRSMGGEAVLFNSGNANNRTHIKSHIIGTVFGSTAHYLLKKYEQLQVPNRIPMNTLFIPPELQLDAFRNGFLNAISVWEPYVSYAVDQFDAHIVFDDSKLPNGGLNFLVVRDGYLEEHPEAVQNFLDALQEGTDWVSNNNIQAEMILTKILATPDMTSYDLYCSSINKYHWDFISSYEQLYQEGIHKELLDISSLLTSEKIAPPLLLQPENIFADINTYNNISMQAKHEINTSTLRIGYSSDLMCSSFLIVGALNQWAKYHFHISHCKQLIAERVIHYDRKSQNSIMDIFRSIREENTKFDAISLRSMLEECLKFQCKKYNLKISMNSKQVGLFSYLEALTIAGVVPENVLSYSHLIRLFGNDAAHSAVSHQPDLPLLLEFTMRIFDWTYHDGSGQCPSCRLALNLEWRFCAGCGYDLRSPTPENNSVALPLNGSEIMTVLNIKEGPQVGKAKLFLLEKMDSEGKLSKEEAIILLRTWFKESLGTGIQVISTSH